MTKRRPPLSIDAALARIAGQLDGGWAAMAAATGRAEGTVRAWGDSDRREGIPLADAVDLDVAFQAAGGQGAPLFEVYALKLELACIDRFANHLEIAALLSSVIKESSEAECAMLRASLPGADAREIREALREVEEALVEMGRARTLLAGLSQSGAEAIPP